jgi:flagellar FliJ protein
MGFLLIIDMKSFSFRLDRVLNYRKHLEKKAQRDLFQAQSVYKKRRETIDTLRDRKRDTAQTLRHMGSKGMTVAVYQIHTKFLNKLQNDLEDEHRHLQEAKKLIKARETLLKKETIKKKTLETMKERQFESHKYKLAWEDQKQMDELVLMRKGQKK